MSLCSALSHVCVCVDISKLEHGSMQCVLADGVCLCVCLCVCVCVCVIIFIAKLTASCAYRLAS